MKQFPMGNQNLRTQFENIAWIGESGWSESELREGYDAIMRRSESESHAILKAELFALLCEHAPLAIDREDIFQDKLFAPNLIGTQLLTDRVIAVLEEATGVTAKKLDYAEIFREKEKAIGI